MSAVQPLAQSATNSIETLEQHIWLGDRRSLCQLAVQTRVRGDGAEQVNHEADAWPVCGSCILIVDTFKNAVDRMLTQANGRIEPARPIEAAKALSRTSWPWVLDMDTWPSRAAASGYPKGNK